MKPVRALSALAGVASGCLLSPLVRCAWDRDAGSGSGAAAASLPALRKLDDEHAAPSAPHAATLADAQRLALMTADRDHAVLWRYARAAYDAAQEPGVGAQQRRALLEECCCRRLA